MTVPEPAPPLPPEVTTWPHLVRIELLAALAATLILGVWSILIDAPLEAPANPNLTPDPAKAPWYFVGLQELLVYFDPWIAGVMLPGLVIVGLAAIPYLDINPRGNGYYTLRERPFAIAVFLLGFGGLWLLPILVGVFFRGPGWSWSMPWESGAVPPVESVVTCNLSDLVGIPSGNVASLFGAGVVGAWYGQAWLWRRRFVGALGGARYAIVAFLFLSMLAVPVKVALRLLFDVKYVWVNAWFSI